MKKAKGRFNSDGERPLNAMAIQNEVPHPGLVCQKKNSI